MTSYPISPWAHRDYWQQRFEGHDTPWDLDRPSAVLLESIRQLEHVGCSVRGASVLIAGAGQGSDAIELAHQGAHVTAIEWSSAAAATIRHRYDEVRSALSGSLEVIEEDFFSVSHRTFDLAAEHTFFCAIDPTMRARYATAISTRIRPGGYLFGNFFIVSAEEAAKLPNLSLSRTGEGPPFATTSLELRTLLEPFFEVCVLEASATSDPGRRPGLEWVAIFKRRAP